MVVSLRFSSTALWYRSAFAAKSPPCAKERRWLCSSDFVGMQATLMHVPPYIFGDFSMIAVDSPFEASAPAIVLPPFPKPMMMFSNSFIRFPLSFCSYWVLLFRKDLFAYIRNSCILEMSQTHVIKVVENAVHDCTHPRRHKAVFFRITTVPIHLNEFCVECLCNLCKSDFCKVGLYFITAAQAFACFNKTCIAERCHNFAHPCRVRADVVCKLFA